MELQDYKRIVHDFFSTAHPLEHRDDRPFTFRGTRYYFRPDDTYIFPEYIIVIEYEAGDRPVESITKYWWLLSNPKWHEHNIKLKCLFLATRDLSSHRKYTRHRIEIVPILGDELVAKFPNAFEFYFMPAEKITEVSIHRILKQLLS